MADLGSGDEGLVFLLGLGLRASRVIAFLAGGTTWLL